MPSKTGVILAVVIAAVVSDYCAAAASEAEEAAPLATPAGIRIEALRRPLKLYYLTGRWDNKKAQKASLTNRVYADELGKTLYVFDDDKESDKSACEDACERSWSPAAVAPDAQPIPNWSIVTRKHGSRQWAHEGRPLYTFVNDKEPGEANGDGLDARWHIALYSQTRGVATPPGISVSRRVFAADAPTFVDHRGMTLYIHDESASSRAFSCEDDCTKAWRPASAGQLSKPFGAWSVNRREDGTQQWAYKGRPLYTYAGDAIPGDSKGQTLKGWRVASLETQFLPPNVAVGQSDEGWTVLTTAGGMTLYAQDYFRGMRLSFNLNTLEPLLDAVPEDGRSIGTVGCADPCARMWPPLQAPADARSTGYWSVVGRSDGSKQWAYKGFPLYTYSQDRRAGDAFGNDVFDYSTYARNNQYYMAIYWRAAAP